MTFSIEEHRSMAAYYVALARKQASSQLRWQFMRDARQHHTSAKNMAHFAKR